jgi:type VI secretion system protein ImpK
LLLLGFLMFWLLRIGSGQSAMDAMLSVNPPTPLRLSRAAPAPTLRRSDQTGRLEKALADDVARRVVVIDQDVDGSRVRTTVGSLFAPGSDTLEPGMAALFERIADATKTEPGAIRIEGHADVDPVSSVTFPDNVSLSKARAEQVASIFQARLRGGRTIAADGFGATRPLASNATAEGKALNRRVEIVLFREK